jgi:hypothetical protein
MVMSESVIERSSMALRLSSSPYIAARSSLRRTLTSSFDAFQASTIKVAMDAIRVTRFLASKIKAGQLHLLLPHQGAHGCGPPTRAGCTLPCHQEWVHGGHLHRDWGTCLWMPTLRTHLRYHEDVDEMLTHDIVS